MSKKGFYVYALCRPDGSVFYVGKGKGNRKNHHETEARTDATNRKCEIILEVWASGGQVAKRILFETDSEKESYQEEIRQIAMHGRASLANNTNGGGAALLSFAEDVALTLCNCRFCTQEAAEYLALQRDF